MSESMSIVSKKDEKYEGTGSPCTSNIESRYGEMMRITPERKKSFLKAKSG